MTGLNIELVATKLSGWCTLAVLCLSWTLMEWPGSFQISRELKQGTPVAAVEEPRFAPSFEQPTPAFAFTSSARPSRGLGDWVYYHGRHNWADVDLVDRGPFMRSDRNLLLVADGNDLRAFGSRQLAADFSRLSGRQVNEVELRRGEADYLQIVISLRDPSRFDSESSAVVRVR